MPKVSVIIPAYNCAKYITEAIESVLKQTYTDFEIVVVNDGSTDNTEEVLKEYIENGIVNYIYQKNKGVSAARNRGIISAKGDYIAFLDADDFWEPEKIGQQVEAFQEYPGAGLSFSNYQKVDESKGIQQLGFCGRVDDWFNKHRVTPDLAYGWLYRELLIGDCVITISVLVKRAVLEEIGLFDETFKIGEDYDLWLRIAQKYPLLYINRVLCKYRYRPDSASGPADIRELRWTHSHIMVREKHLANNWIPLEYKGLVKNILGRLCWNIGWSYFSQNLFRESRSLFFRGMYYRPIKWNNWLYWFASFLPLQIIEVIRRIKRSAS